MTELVDIPNINKVMTKPEQASALLKEGLSFVELPKNKKKHNKKQVEEVKASIVHFFPDLTTAIKGI